MASIRLTEKQIRYLRGRGGVHTLYAALERFLSGELVTEKCDSEENQVKLLPFSIHKPIRRFTPYQIRAILNAHIRNPVNYGSQIAKLGAEIEAMIPKAEYILEKDNG